MTNSSLRLVHIADVHLGYRRFHRLSRQGFNQREVDVGLAFKESIDRTISLRPQVVLIAGDLFHTVRPSNAVITFAFRELSRLSVALGAPIVLIAGNHDTPRRSDSGSLLRLFGEISHLYVSDSAIDRFDFPELDLSVTCLPHAGLADVALNTPSMAPLRGDERRKFNILVAHGQFDARIVSDFGGVDLPISKLAPHEWDYMALGHVHARLDVGSNGAYAGSTEHTSSDIWRGANENKGFLSVDLPSGKRVFHELTSPRELVVMEPIDGAHLTATEVSLRIVKDLDAIPGGLEGKIVRLPLLNISRELMRALDHRAIRLMRAKALNLTIDVRPPKREEGESYIAPKVRRSLSDELKSFAQQWPGRSLRTEQVVQTVERLVKQLEEQHEARPA